MLALFAALVFASPQQPTAWERAAGELRGVAATYAKWGITFEVDRDKTFAAANAPVPGHLQVTSTMATPDTLKLKIASAIGEKQALALELGGTFQIDPDGNATEGNGAVYVEGTGLAGKFRYDKDQGLQLEAGVEETFYTLGIQLGNSRQGPVAFGLKLGPLTVNVDVGKWAQRCQLMAPTLLQQGAGKIGGVSLQFDADAMAAALQQDEAPPARFLRDRLLVALPSLTKDVADLGPLNHLDGVLLDDANHQLLFVGSHDDNLPPLPCDVVAAVARAVYVQHLHPYISLDPQDGEMKLPHKPRIGGVPDELRHSQLILSMLTADYAMKQLQLGHHTVAGVPALMDLIDKDSNTERGGSFRFWINPAPLAPGDVRLSTAQGTRYFQLRTTPIILCESLTAGAALPAPLAFADSAAAELWQQEVDTAARALTAHYADVERSWPESDFGRARQALELSGLFTLLQQVDNAPWLPAQLQALAARELPQVEVPDGYPGLESRTSEIQGIKVGVRGGMITDLEVPAPTPGVEPIAAADIRWSGATGTLPPTRPGATEPRPLDAAEAGAQELYAAQQALRAKDFDAALAAATAALQLVPESQPALLARLTAMANLGSEEFGTELEAALERCADNWQVHYLHGLACEEMTKNTGMLLPSDISQYAAMGLADAADTVRLRPDFAPALALQARLLHQQERYDESLAVWTKALGLAPDSLDFRQCRAACEIQLEQLDAARADLDAAMQMAPMLPMLHVVRGELLARMQQLPLAIADLEAATQVDPTGWLWFDILGKLRLQNGDDAGAIAAFDRAAVLVPRDTMQQLMEQSDPDVSLKLFIVPMDPLDNFVKRFGEAPRNPFQLSFVWLVDPELFLLRGTAHLHLQHWQAAKTDLERFVKYQPERAAEVAAQLLACKQELDKGN